MGDFSEALRSIPVSFRMPQAPRDEMHHPVIEMTQIHLRHLEDGAYCDIPNDLYPFDLPRRIAREYRPHHEVMYRKNSATAELCRANTSQS